MTNRTLAARAALVSLAALAAVATSLSSPAASAQASKRVKLFNGKNFDGWYIFIRDHAKNEDPKKIFTIQPDGAIHVSGEIFGYLSTEKEYDNYRLSLEFKWGEKKYPPRENAKRDAGILYHAVGRDKVWMESLELQIQEGDTGDMWLTGGDGGKPALTVRGQRYVGGRVVKFADYEKPNGEWNKVEVVCRGATIQHYVNGHLNMEGTDASLTRGKINLQSEGAELWYRNIYIEPLD